MKTQRRVWWCEEHGTNSWDEAHTFCLLKPGLDDVDDTPCRMSEMWLVSEDMTIWWCLQHGAVVERDSVYGVMGCWKQGTVGADCRSVEMRLIPVGPEGEKDTSPSLDSE